MKVISMKNFVMLAMVLSIVSLTHAEEAVTRVGDRLSMQCGAHKIVLTCGHNDEIAMRQRSRPRLCNDNKVEFFAEDGSVKTFTTYGKGQHRDKTPVRATCEALIPLDIFEVSVQVHDTAWSFGVLFKENGKRLNDDNGNGIRPNGYPRYRIDYKETKTTGRIQIQEKK